MLKDNRAVTSRIVESSLSVETGATAVPTVTDTNKRGYIMENRPSNDSVSTLEFFVARSLLSLPLFSRPL